MNGRVALISTLTAIILTGSTGQIAAHDDSAPPQATVPSACLEPLKPIVDAFVERAEEDELRREFEFYFKEVETYLDCLNAESHRIRQEAKNAAYEFNQVLDRFPPSPENQPEFVPDQPMVSSGQLNLDYRGSRG